MSSHGDRPRTIGLGISFNNSTQADEAPPTDHGLTIDHLVHAQKHCRALIMDGHGAAESFAKTREYSVLLQAHDYQAIGGEAVKVYPKLAGDLTLEELALCNYHGSLGDFLKQQNYRADTPVSYAILDPRRHVLLDRDDDGALMLAQDNPDFKLHLH